MRSSSPGTRARTPTLSSKDIWEKLRAASAKDGVVAKSTGDIAKGLATGERFDAAYELPFLAHATMEPLNCTVQFKPDGCEIWTGTQIMARVQSEAAKAAGLPVDKVTVHNHLIGGGFGRRLEPDMVVAAVRIAKAGRRPGQGRVDPRGRHPARHLSPGLSRHDFRQPVGRQDRRLEISRRRLVDHRALAAAGLPERHRHRRRR